MVYGYALAGNYALNFAHYAIPNFPKKSLIMLIIILFKLVIVIIMLIIQCTMLNYKLCMTIFIHTLCCIIIKFQRALYCKIVESDTHVKEVSLGIYMVSANTEKPR